jgi:hypothetical protein
VETLEKHKGIVVHLQTQDDEGAETIDFQIEKQISAFNAQRQEKEWSDLHWRSAWGGGMEEKRKKHPPLTHEN